MNIKSNPINYIAVTVLVASVSLGALALNYTPQATVYSPAFAIPNTTPVEYGIQALKLTSDKSGVATIKLDGFLVQVGFDFEMHPDSYGVTGSDFTAIEINNLSVDQITDLNGKTYRDFTDYNDHRNINLLISAYIEKNNLVEAV